MDGLFKANDEIQGTKYIYDSIIKGNISLYVAKKNLPVSFAVATIESKPSAPTTSSLLDMDDHTSPPIISTVKLQQPLQSSSYEETQGLYGLMGNNTPSSAVKSKPINKIPLNTAISTPIIATQTSNSKKFNDLLDIFDTSSSSTTTQQSNNQINDPFFVTPKKSTGPIDDPFGNISSIDVLLLDNNAKPVMPLQTKPIATVDPLDELLGIAKRPNDDNDFFGTRIQSNIPPPVTGTQSQSQWPASDNRAFFQSPVNPNHPQSFPQTLSTPAQQQTQQQQQQNNPFDFF